MIGTVTGRGLWFAVALTVLVYRVTSVPVELPGLCRAENRDPCAAFPDLCSAGGGRCVVKGPCEYQCLCPPDGRVGRDCTSSANPQPGAVVDTLLIFPKDIFLDANHVAKSQDFVVPNLHTTTEPKSVIKIDTVTTTLTEATSLKKSSVAPSKTALIQETATTSSSLKSTILAPLLPSSEAFPSDSSTREHTTASASTVNSNAVGIDRLDTFNQNVSPTVNISRNESSTSSTRDWPSAAKPQNQQNEDKKTVIMSTIQEDVMSKPVDPARAVSKKSHQGEKIQALSMLKDTSEQPPKDTGKQTTVNTSEDMQSTTAAVPWTANNTSKDLGHTNYIHHVLVRSSSSTRYPTSDLRQTSERSKPIALTSLTKSVISSSHHDTPTKHNSSNPAQSLVTDNSQITTATSSITIQPHLPTTVTTTVPAQHFSFSSRYGLTSNPPPSNSSKSPPPSAVVDEFPTLFKVTSLDNPLPQSDPGVNSPLTRVVHRIFLPRDQFEMALKSGLR